MVHLRIQTTGKVGNRKSPVPALGADESNEAELEDETDGNPWPLFWSMPLPVNQMLRDLGSLIDRNAIEETWTLGFTLSSLDWEERVKFHHVRNKDH